MRQERARPAHASLHNDSLIHSFNDSIFLCPLPIIPPMEYRMLGTGTFGGNNPVFTGFGTSDVAEATRLVDVCLEAGLTMFDSADIYSTGAAEEILGQAIRGRRDK